MPGWTTSTAKRIMQMKRRMHAGFASLLAEHPSSADCPWLQSAHHWTVLG